MNLKMLEKLLSNCERGVTFYPAKTSLLLPWMLFLIECTSGNAGKVKRSLSVLWEGSVPFLRIRAFPKRKGLLSHFHQTDLVLGLVKPRRRILHTPASCFGTDCIGLPSKNN